MLSSSQTPAVSSGTTIGPVMLNASLDPKQVVDRVVRRAAVDDEARLVVSGAPSR